VKNSRSIIPAFFLVFLCVLAAHAEEQGGAPPAFSLSIEGGGGYVDEPGRKGSWGGFYDLGAIDLSYASALIDFGAAGHFTNDGKYQSTDNWMAQLGKQYFMLDEGYTRLHAGGFAFQAGYLQSVSSIDTPYEVFLNPLAPSSLGMDLAWEDSLFQYESRYIAVNVRSSNAYGWGPTPKSTEMWLDKGVNYRLIALKFSGLRVGYEESSVYLRGFDANYFFSPLPSILTNTLLTQGNNPWTEGGNGMNDNSLMGLFADYKSGPLYGEAQLLVDDINLDFLLPAGSPLRTGSLNKLAWSVGGKYTFPFGTLGFWHGGATAHTYAATYPADYSPSQAPPFDANTIPYEYMYIPSVIFNGNEVDPRDSNIGFPWGENALAFKVTFDTVAFRGTPWTFDLSSSLEYVLNGSKSPDNPWHEYTSIRQIPEQIQLFNVGGPEVLNQILILHAGVKKALGDFEAGLAVDVGGDFNALQVNYGDAAMQARNEPPLLKPVSGLNRLILGIQVTLRYVFSR
jgi:hypothetical protein